MAAMDERPTAVTSNQVFSVFTSSGTRISPASEFDREVERGRCALHPEQVKVLSTMRATFARVALVTILSTALSGCTSGPTWSSLAWWHKKPESTAVADAPKFTPGNPALPSAAQNPAASLAGMPNANAAMAAAAAAGAPGAPGYGAATTEYQNSAYPTTGYQQAKISPAAGNSAAVATPPANAWATTGAANTWSTGAPGAPVGYGTPSAMPGKYAPATNPTTVAATPGYGATAATTPAYGAAPASPAGAQPQSGFYNPTYDGGGTATRYASGAPIPQSTSSTNMMASAAAPSASMPAAPDYRTADARSAMAGASAPMASSPAPTAGSYAPPAASNPSTDRYAGFNTASAPSGSSMPPIGTGYAPPPTASMVPAASMPAASMPGTGDRYAQPTGGIQPAPDQSSSVYQPATTVNPASAYSPPDGSGSAAMSSTPDMSSLPSRGNSEYRPGGTTNYVTPASGQSQPSNNGSQPDSHSPSVVTPASFQSTQARSPSGVTLASATMPIPSSTGTSAPTPPTRYGASPVSEPAYGAPNPVASTPALLPTQSSGW
jgi:hypothetical protein